MTSHRKFPKHDNGCNWCGEPIGARLRKDGSARKIQAAWHTECIKEYLVCMGGRDLKIAIAERDGAKCWDCEKDFTDQVHCLEDDHDVPLWKVRHLPVEERRWYYTLANRRLRCGECHRHKTSKEASERAHHKRLSTGGKTRRGPPIKSRPFDKSLSKKFSGEVVRKET